MAREAARDTVPRMIHGIYKALYETVASPEMYARHVGRHWKKLHDTEERSLGDPFAGGGDVYGAGLGRAPSAPLLDDDFDDGVALRGDAVPGGDGRTGAVCGARRGRVRDAGALAEVARGQSSQGAFRPVRGDCTRLPAFEPRPSVLVSAPHGAHASLFRNHSHDCRGGRHGVVLDDERARQRDVQLRVRGHARRESARPARRSPRRSRSARSSSSRTRRASPRRTRALVVYPVSTDFFRVQDGV